MTKLLGKIEELLSTDLEGVNSWSIKEATKLVANTTLSQLKSKRSQIGELDSAIATKIVAEDELEEEILNSYQFTLDDCIAYLTEFIRKASQPPPLGPIHLTWLRLPHLRQQTPLLVR